MPLVTTGDLALFLHHSVKADAAAVAIRVSEGWLRSVCTSLPTWPDPVPDDLWAWALELAGLAYDNPQSMVSRTTDEETRSWELRRRKEILDAAKDRYGGSAAETGGPSGDFPIALDWPDGPQIGLLYTND